MSSRTRIRRIREQATTAAQQARHEGVQTEKRTDRRMIPWRPAQSNNAATHETTTNASMEM